MTWDNFSVTAICGADINNDGTVNVDDLLAVVNAWGDSGAADVTLNGVVNVDDLLMVINDWGRCS